MWLDLRTTEDNKLHGSGRAVGNGSGGINIQIDKEAEDEDQIFVYVYLVCDAQMNIKNDRLKDIVY